MAQLKDVSRRPHDRLLIDVRSGEMLEAQAYGCPGVSAMIDGASLSCEGLFEEKQ
jgi:hypothetical protein